MKSLLLTIVGSSDIISRCKDDSVISAREDDIIFSASSSSNADSRSLKLSGGPKESREEESWSEQACNKNTKLFEG